MINLNTLLVLLLITASSAYAQLKKTHRDDLSVINRDWKLIKTNANTYGIETKGGKIIVQPVYTKIEQFGVYAKDLALVQNVSEVYGFIDTTGKEVIPSQYELKYIKSHFSVLRNKFIKPAKQTKP